MKTVHVAEAERPLSIARLTWFRWLEIKAVNNRGKNFAVVRSASEWSRSTPASRVPVWRDRALSQFAD
jgi:hypothetical protein